MSDDLARQIAHAYPELRGEVAWRPITSGFSGAWVWQVATPRGTYALKAWPPGEPPTHRLARIHQLLQQAREAGLEFVPRVVPTERGLTWMALEGRMWELTTWQPGTADFWSQPSLAKLVAAVTALAQIHIAWPAVATRREPAPAVVRRLERLAEWTPDRCQALEAQFKAHPEYPLTPLGRRGLACLRRRIEPLRRDLEPWRNALFFVRPCLRDIWHDHVLFTDDRVTGIIDFGGVRRDHPATDLARLLGSLVGDDAAWRSAALDAYSQWRQLTDEDCLLVTVLDRTGVAVGVGNWLKSVFLDGRPFPSFEAVAARLGHLVERLEKQES
jgi:Ser/Thr protein kinase RdoA (MazF antagonist)